MGKTNCEEHRRISEAIKANGEEANLLREMLKISLSKEQKTILNDALIADQNAIVELVRKRSLHINECGECKKGE